MICICICLDPRMTSWIYSFGGILRSTSDDESESTRSITYQRKQLCLDMDCFPQIEGESEILTVEDIQSLSDSFPSRILGSKWQLVFTTSLHGYNLSSLYRRCKQEVHSPTLLCVEDTRGNVFGSFLSCPIKLHDSFYGTGESFLFTCRPEFKIFNWSGENLFFARGYVDSLLIGAGEGKFGLWLDSSLYQGRSEACITYKNCPLVPGGGDFIVRTVECWSFE